MLMTGLTVQQREKISQRLALHTDPCDRGELHETVAQALGVEGAAGRVEALVDALRGDRVLLPVVIAKGAPLDVPIVRMDTDWGAAMVAFSSVHSLSRALPHARPLPTSARKAALSALGESQGRIIFDPQGAAILIPRPATLALSVGEKWLPAWRDEELRGQLRTAVTNITSLIDIRVEYGGGASVNVELVVRGDMDPTVVRQEVATAIGVLTACPRLQAATDRVVFTPLWAHLA